jgi:nicotinate-nucleotide pyrophosphorylase (carboxylating)
VARVLSLTFQEVTIMFLPQKILEYKLLQILAEDIGQGDATTSLVVKEGTNAQAVVVAKQSGIVAGIEEAKVLLESLGLDSKPLVKDGQEVKARQVLLNISGNARNILAVERTLLNLLSRMSGIASATRNIVEKLHAAKLKTKVACTRKTAPGLMYFDKKAVQLGGGDTHRLHLDDMILIKDNHIAIVGSFEKAVEIAKKHASISKKVEVEVTKSEDVKRAVENGADIVMLDNFTPKNVEKAVDLLKKNHLRGKVLLEASGGITAENVLEYASTGVDLVSLGELTQSPRALDMSLEIIRVTKKV